MYQRRGVGSHVTSLLRRRPSGFDVVGLTDPALPPLPDDLRSTCDEVTPNVNQAFGSNGSIFIEMSPMTHDPALTMRFNPHPRLLTASVIYDFIPIDWPGYLTRTSDRIAYVASLACLKNFDVFFPISEYSGRRLQELLGISPANITVTGASVRESLYGESSPTGGDIPAQPYFVTVGGGDRRKNTEVAVRAVRELNRRVEAPLSLCVVGHYGPDYKEDLIRIASEEADPQFLKFYSGIDDSALRALYGGAIATIAPSHIEGFSLPVVEAVVCGSPAVVSMCAAQLELVSDLSAVFPSEDADALTSILETLLRNPEQRGALFQSQAHLAAKFHEHAVGTRFWDGLLSALEKRPWYRNFTRYNLGARPRIAFLSPFPPEESGCARFTERTIEAARDEFTIDLYTNAPRPLLNAGAFRDAGPVTRSALLTGRYDSIISVLGNSTLHNPVFEFVEQFGGPVVLHDSRLTHVYYQRLGLAGMLDFASEVLKRPVTRDELTTWLHDTDVESLFVERVLERAEPLIVHTPAYRQLLADQYEFDAQLAVFPPNYVFSDQDLSPEAISAARSRLGVSDDTFLVATFGFVAEVKGLYACLLAIEQLRYWGINAQLHLVGKFDAPQTTFFETVKRLGLEEYVVKYETFVDPDLYRCYMIGSDAGVQLRHYGFGQPSAALVDCIAAGLPSVSSASLAVNCEAPGYVRMIPDRPSPLLLAEALADIADSPDGRRRATNPERIEYCQSHSFAVYVKRLKHILGW